MSDKDGCSRPPTRVHLHEARRLQSSDGGISFLKKFTELKFEVRKGITKAGILYFKNSVKGCIPVHRLAEIGPIEPVKNLRGRCKDTRSL